MTSLKAFSSMLAEVLGTTPAAVYERQRALVRRGLLPTPVGRGRGNGVPASAATLAIIILAFMATDNLSETDDRVRRLASAEYQSRRSKPRGLREPPPCELTGQRTFLDALVALLQKNVPPTCVSVTVWRNQLTAEINWSDLGEGPFRSSYFGASVERESYLHVKAHLEDRALALLRTALQKIEVSAMPVVALTNRSER